MFANSVLMRSTRTPYLLFQTHAERRIFITLPAQYVIVHERAYDFFVFIDKFRVPCMTNVYMMVSLKTSHRRWNSFSRGGSSGIARLCSQVADREGVIIIVLQQFSFWSLVTRWSEFNLSTKLLYIHVRFFGFYGNKYPTAEFVRGWLEFSSPCHCDRENIYR